MVADLPKYKKYKNVTFGLESKSDSIYQYTMCDKIKVKYTLIKDYVVETLRKVYLDNIVFELHSLKFKSVKEWRTHFKEFIEYQKQLKKLGMKTMSKMNKRELIRAILKLEWLLLLFNCL